MLAFSSYIDSHFHLPCCTKNLLESSFVLLEKQKYYACTCSHAIDEFFLQEKLIAEYSKNINARNTNKKNDIHFVSSFGMHPQLPLTENADFMENLLQEKRITCIGEIGFDNFLVFRENEKAQEEAWHICLELSIKYNVPIVVHCRKAMNKIFRDVKLLSKIPSVIFHSFMGSPLDARSLLNKNVNAYFSFGNPLIMGDKSARSCIKDLPLTRLLLETDSPYQCLRGELETRLDAIFRVYETAFSIRENEDTEQFSKTLFTNFKNAFAISLECL